jgi:hypothetical protein
LKLLAQLSLGFDEGLSTAEQMKSSREFSIRGRDYYSYELANEGKLSRVVVFAITGKYYQCRATPLKDNFALTEVANIFTVQQTLLSSITHR